MALEAICCLISQDVKITFSAAKWFYFALLSLSGLLTWLIRDYGDPLLERLDELEGCKSDDPNAEENCLGKAAVLRISFATALFHFTHAALLVNCKYVEDPRKVFHTACPGAKWVIWAVLIFASFFMPDGFFRVYGELARAASGLFLVFQAVVIIDFVYELNEAMLDRGECKWTLILLSLLAYTFSFTMMILGYMFFAPRGTCSTNIFWITFTLLLGIFVTALSLSKWKIENSGLFTSGAVIAYGSFLLISALNSQPSDSECVEGGMAGGWIKVVAFLLALGAVVVSTLTSGVSEVLPTGSSGEPLPYRPDFFHLIFGLAAMYLAMLFTNWSLEGSTNELDIDKGWRSAWVKIASQWLVFVVYTWTMVAHKVLDREF
ncbi:hypothetical protein BSKO_01765 [Bryopsis sp. KO-2023]|nr:hypothetical protein BSKO_01765 [Bryopsis sp. KO-2023]